MSDPEPLSQTVEEYLEAILRLTQMPGRASTTRLARHLDVRPASVTGMLRRLSHLGLVSYRRYRNISLTREGERRASQLIRRHRLAERLLTDMLGLPLDQAHAEACRLEHAVSAAVEGRIAHALGGPQACPHGHPIDAEADDSALSLATAPPKRPLTIARLEDESPEVVRYLAQRGLLPGARVKVNLREPLGNAVMVEVAGKRQLLGAALAATIRVRETAPMTSTTSRKNK